MQASHGLPNLDLTQIKVIFDSMLEGVVIHNESGEIIQFNKAALDILGLNADQLLGKTTYDPSWKAINEDYSPTDPNNHPSSVARKTGTIQKNKIMGIHQPSGELKWVSITAVPLLKEGLPSAYQTIITFKDITESIQLKNDLEKSQHELSQVMNALPALIGHWDRNLINLHSNDVYSFYFGKTTEQIRGKHIKELLGPQLFALNLPYMKLALEGKEQIFERDIPLPNGGVKHTLASYIPEIKNGEVQGFFVIVTDISEVKKLESERRILESKLLNSARLSWLGEMASGVAHEINNPLAIILGYINILKREIQDGKINSEEITAQLDKFTNSLKRISNIVKGLGTFSRDASSDPTESILISEQIERVLNLCSQRLLQHSINFVIEPYEDFAIKCRPIQITQVLINLINNAHDAILNTTDPWIKIVISSDLFNLKIKVIDSGTGIDHIADKIMIPFFSTKAPGKGSGLGLSISKSIMEEQKGDLRYLMNQPNTTFEVEIPLENFPK